MKNNLNCKIIPCLDIKNGRVVKGINFENLKDAGDPSEIAQHYSEAGADEVVFLDITATVEGRGTMLDVIRRTSESVRGKTPIAVGGGIRSVADAKAVIEAGADKVGVNSAAVNRPELIRELAQAIGSENVIAAIDGKRGQDGKFYVCINGGKTLTDLDAVEWAKQCEVLGAGEILLTSFDADGTKAGYDLEMTRAIADSVSIPITASGGAGTLEHIYEALTKGGAANALVASLFHFNELTIPQVKSYLKEKGVKIYE
jgi:cyclase